jgi:hypothetical protein
MMESIFLHHDTETVALADKIEAYSTSRSSQAHEVKLVYAHNFLLLRYSTGPTKSSIKAKIMVLIFLDTYRLPCRQIQTIQLRFGVGPLRGDASAQTPFCIHGHNS